MVDLSKTFLNHLESCQLSNLGRNSLKLRHLKKRDTTQQNDFGQNQIDYCIVILKLRKVLV